MDERGAHPTTTGEGACPTPRSRVVCTLAALALLATAHAEPYRERLLSDHPVAYWTFDELPDCCFENQSHATIYAKPQDSVGLACPGPRPPEHPLFEATNMSLDFTEAPHGVYVAIKDPGPASVFDFTNGDTFTAEAWARPLRLAKDQTASVLGKGRTAAASENQNWALQLREVGGTPRLTFLFHDKETPGPQGWHRFTATRGFPAGDAWHHLAATYTFGQPDSARLTLDGVEIPGAWDLGGPTTTAPIVDDDEVWIGGAEGGSTAFQFPGMLDEIAIYRTALTPEQLRQHAGR